MKYLVLFLLAFNACAPALPTVEQNFKMVMEITCYHFLKANDRIEEFTQCVNALASKPKILEFKSLKKHNDKE